MSMVTWLPPTRDAVGVDEVPAGEHADRGRAAAQIDHDARPSRPRRRRARRGPPHRGVATIASTSRWQRSTASIRLRAARVGRTTRHACRRRASRRPCRAGSSMPRVASSAKPVGSECSTARPGASRSCWPLRARDACRRRSPMAAQRRRRRDRIREPSRPPVMLTMTAWISTLAMRSAASTARRIACSAASRSTMAPPFSPRERWWPMPRMRARCVRPAQRVRSRQPGPAGPTRHTTLLVPTSSTDSTALLRGDSGFRRGVRLGLRWLTWRFPLACFGRALSISARAAAASSPRRITTRSGWRRSMASTSLVENLVVALAAPTDGSRASRGALLRQLHVDAIVHLQRSSGGTPTSVPARTWARNSGSLIPAAC